jgi:thiamine-monophosphate kinase
MSSEFDFIENIKIRHRLNYVGDDCAVLPKDEKTDLVITSDMLVEDIDFRLDWTTPELLGHKALAVSLSDVAAMGATPRSAMLSIGIPQGLWKTDFMERFYEGWHNLARRFDVELIGGDTSRTPDHLVIDSTVLGDVARGQAILRSGAKPTDALFVTGFLGGAAAGLKLLENGSRFDDHPPATVKHLLFRQLQPLAQVKTANHLHTHGLANAMIDISDGLSSELAHIARASRVGCRVIRSAIPVDPAINSVLGSIDADPLDLALHGGEDFELLLAVDEKNFSVVQDLGFHYIGEVTESVGVVELSDGSTVMKLEPKGYSHFQPKTDPPNLFCKKTLDKDF